LLIVLDETDIQLSLHQKIAMFVGLVAAGLLLMHVTLLGRNDGIDWDWDSGVACRGFHRGQLAFRVSALLYLLSLSSLGFKGVMAVLLASTA
jgi:hypothetical protein